MDEHFEGLLMAFLAVVGTIATVIYYFARYYFRADPSDTEIARSLRDSEKIENPKPAPVAELPLPKSLHQSLEKTRASIWGRVSEALRLRPVIQATDLEALEEILYTADIGSQTVSRLLGSLQSRLDAKGGADLDGLHKLLKEDMLQLFQQESMLGKPIDFSSLKSLGLPQVWMIVGVNGVGKTTSIGKLAHQAAQAGMKTLIVAGDTFRAAAGEQLRSWSERAKVDIFFPEGVKDPSAVAFDGYQKAKANGYDLVLLDTAGRLHTQDHLMEELKKIKRVLGKISPEAPHETLLILDANSGQNALVQAKNFHQAIELTGVVLTKMDGSAKGGVALGIASDVKVPIRWIGVGESIADLRVFDAKEFVDSIL